MPTVYSRRLKGMFDREAKNTASSPKNAATSGKPTKPLFINATSMRYMPLSPSFIRSSPGLSQPMPMLMSVETVISRIPRAISLPDISSSLFMTEDRIMPARNTFITSLLSPLLNSGPTSFRRTQR